MSVVDMDRDLVGKVIKAAVGREMVADDVLKGRGNEEILLRQSQKLALVVIVRRVKDL